MASNIRRFHEKDAPIVDQSPFVVEDYTVDTENATIPLIGLYNEEYANGITESLLWLTESFAGPNPPARAVKGQCWFNTSNSLLYTYNGADFRDGGDSTLLDDWIVPVDINAQDLLDHTTNTSNPHAVTKAQVGLGNVTDDAQFKLASLFSELDTQPKKATARTNLDVYSKAEINANFAASGSTVTNSNQLGGLTADQFLRADVDDSCKGKITFFKDGVQDGSIFFSQNTGEPITLDNGDIKFTVHDNTGNFNIKAGVNVINGSDTYRTSGDGAVKATWTYAAGSGVGFVVSVADPGTVGNIINFSNSTFKVKTDSLYWNNSKVLNDSGFTIKGNIVPNANNTLNVGSATLGFSNIYSTNFVGKASDSALLNGVADSESSTSSTVVKRTSTGQVKAQAFVADNLATQDADLSNTSQVVFRDATTGVMKHATKTAVKDWLGIVNTTGGGVGVVAWMTYVQGTVSIAPSVVNASGCTISRLDTGLYRISFTPEVMAIIGNTTNYTVIVSSTSDLGYSNSIGTAAMELYDSWYSGKTNSHFDIVTKRIYNYPAHGGGNDANTTQHFVNDSIDNNRTISFLVLF